ncbi:MAG TPA: VCBS repeat-containing protein, partial [Flavitalea sp.]|nr:VCBS repeat-containing protein [Flavitalea sp.]
KNHQGKKLVNQTSSFGLDSSSGWWCKLIATDIDQDGDTDLIAGNLGSNTQFRVSAAQPMVTYVGDFNQDGRIDPVMTWWVQGESYPYNSRDELIEQMPQLNKLFLRYEDYANAPVTRVIGEDQAKSALKINIRETRSSVFINEAGKFLIKPLPLEAQFSMMNGILYRDFDGDGKNDILGAGNFFPFRVQLGRCDASKGSLFSGHDKSEFITVGYKRTGLDVEGDVRDMVELKGRRSSCIVISRNNATLLVLQPAHSIITRKK